MKKTSRLLGRFVLFYLWLWDSTVFRLLLYVATVDATWDILGVRSSDPDPGTTLRDPGRTDGCEEDVRVPGGSREVPGVGVSNDHGETSTELIWSRKTHRNTMKINENQWKSLKHTNKLWNKLNGILLGFRRRWTSHCSWRSQKFRLGRSSAAFNPTEIQSIPRDDLQPTGWELKVGWESWESWLCRLCNPHPIMVRIQR